MSVGFVRADFIIAAIYQEFAFLWAHHVASAFSFLGLRLPQTEPALTLSPVGSQTVSLTVSRKSSTELCWAVISRLRPQPRSCSAKRSARLQFRIPARLGKKYSLGLLKYRRAPGADHDYRNRSYFTSPYQQDEPLSKGTSDLSYSSFGPPRFEHVPTCLRLYGLPGGCGG